MINANRPHILFTPSNYPSTARPTVSTFVRQFVRAVARSGAKCTVLAPIRLPEVLRSGRRDAKISFDDSVKTNPITLIRPIYASFSKKKALGLNTGRWTYLSFRRACIKSLRLLDDPVDMVMGHFLYSGGATAVHIGRILGIPAFVRVGESGNWSVSNLANETVMRDFMGVAGMVANSEALGLWLSNDFGLIESRVITAINGVDRKLFSPRNQKQMRTQLGLPHNRFLIAFVGHFDERKGPHRLMTAVQDMEDVGLIFIGSGEIPLQDKRIVHKGRIDHDHIPEYLSAADIFVLPTLMEGSCNAVLEALACGLPVVSSDREFNHTALDETCSILIEPTDTQQIRNAIMKLKTDAELRQNLSRGALARADELDIDASAARILNWMQTFLTDDHVNNLPTA